MYLTSYTIRCGFVTHKHIGKRKTTDLTCARVPDAKKSNDDRGLSRANNVPSVYEERGSASVDGYLPVCSDRNRFEDTGSEFAGWSLAGSVLGGADPGGLTEDAAEVMRVGEVQPVGNIFDWKPFQ